MIVHDLNEIATPSNQKTVELLIEIDFDNYFLCYLVLPSSLIVESSIVKIQTNRIEFRILKKDFSLIILFYKIQKGMVILFYKNRTIGWRK